MRGSSCATSPASMPGTVGCQPQSTIFRKCPWLPRWQWPTARRYGMETGKIYVRVWDEVRQYTHSCRDLWLLTMHVSCACIRMAVIAVERWSSSSPTPRPCAPRCAQLVRWAEEAVLKVRFVAWFGSCVGLCDCTWTLFVVCCFLSDCTHCSTLCLPFM